MIASIYQHLESIDADVAHAIECGISKHLNDFEYFFSLFSDDHLMSMLTRLAPLSN
jgi:hypothetical protein